MRTAMIRLGIFLFAAVICGAPAMAAGKPSVLISGDMPASAMRAISKSFEIKGAYDIGLASQYLILVDAPTAGSGVQRASPSKTTQTVVLIGPASQRIATGTDKAVEKAVKKLLKAVPKGALKAAVPVTDWLDEYHTSYVARVINGVAETRLRAHIRQPLLQQKLRGKQLVPSSGADSDERLVASPKRLLNAFVVLSDIAALERLWPSLGRMKHTVSDINMGSLPPVLDRSPLEVAAALSDTETLEFLLNKSPGVSETTFTTMARGALEHGSLANYRVLAALSPPAFARSRNTALAVASFMIGKDVQAFFGFKPGDEYDFIKWLLESGAEPNLGNFDGESIFGLVVKAGREDLFELFMAAGVGVNAIGQDYVADALRAGHHGMFKQLVLAGAPRKPEHYTLAFEADDTDAAALLAAVETPLPENAEELFANAFYTGKADRVHVLLTAGYTPPASGPGSVSFLHRASANLNGKLVELMTYYYDINQQDADGRTPLHYSMPAPDQKRTEKHKEVYDLLVRLGADPAVTDNSGHDAVTSYELARAEHEYKVEMARLEREEREEEERLQEELRSIERDRERASKPRGASVRDKAWFKAAMALKMASEEVARDAERQAAARMRQAEAEAARIRTERRREMEERRRALIAERERLNQQQQAATGGNTYAGNQQSATASGGGRVPNNTGITYSGSISGLSPVQITENGGSQGDTSGNGNGQNGAAAVGSSYNGGAGGASGSRADSSDRGGSGGTYYPAPAGAQAGGSYGGMGGGSGPYEAQSGTGGNQTGGGTKPVKYIWLDNIKLELEGWVEGFSSQSMAERELTTGAKARNRFTEACRSNHSAVTGIIKDARNVRVNRNERDGGDYYDGSSILAGYCKIAPHEPAYEGIRLCPTGRRGQPGCAVTEPE